MHMVGKGVQLIGVVFAEHDGEVPLKTVLHTFGTMSHWVVGPYIYRSYRFVGMVHTGQKASVAPAIHNIVVLRVHGNMCGFTSCCFFPIVFTDGSIITSVIDSDGRVVLLRHINSIWEGIIRSNPVKLCRRLIVIGTPRFTAIKTYLGTTIIGHDHTVGIFRCNPKIVVVSVRCVVGFEGLSSIRTFMIAHVEYIDYIFIIGVGIDTGIVPRSLP